MSGGREGTGARRRRLLLGAVLLLLLLLGGAAPASAHAALRSCDPADGAVLASAPRSLTLTFSESVGLLDDSFRVYDPHNHRVRTGPARHAPGRSDTARVSLPTGLGTGTFTVAWRVVSADSHPVAGALTYSVGKPSAAPTPVHTGPAEDPATGSLYDIARYVAYAAVVLLVGVVTFRAVCLSSPAEPLNRLVLSGWWALFAATVALLVLRAPYENGTGPAAALDLSALGRTAAGRPGLLLLARLALLLVAGVLLRRGRAIQFRPAGVVLAVALALTWAGADHAAAGIQVPVAMASAVLHLLAAAVWLGGLTALLTLLHRAPGTLTATALTRFSRLAFACVTVLAVTGVYQSWRGLGSWDALATTTYGRILIAKLATVAMLLGAAAWSRRWTTRMPAEAIRERVLELVGGPSAAGPAVRMREEAHDRRGLRRSVLVEVAVGAVVLMLTTVLTGTVPGRAVAEAQGPGAASGIPAASVTTVPFAVGDAGGKVQVTLDPGRVGENSVQAVVFGPGGGIAAVPELRIDFTLPARRIGPIDAKVTDRGGYWASDSLNLPMPGTWRMNVTVRVSALDQVTESRPVRIEGGT